MATSMTGFARQRFELAGSALVIEVKTLNHKTLDIHCRLPEPYWALDVPLRRRVKDYVCRGRVDLKISLEQENAGAIELNQPVYAAYLQILQAVSPPGTSWDPVALLSLPQILTSREEELPEESFWPFLEDTLARLRADREREGDLLWADIQDKVRSLAELLNRLEGLAALQEEEVGTRLRQRLSQLGELEENRVLTEVALLADKSNINEEMVRFRAHLGELEKWGGRREAVGRRLEFLGQEMLREVNTIAAKSALYEISKTAVEIKSQLEKIREQVLNIE